ncbi:hypothetical protein EGW08_017489 [Elysia chlorotica]|uniref:Phospholipase B-like n=1 Tax=Elysia chlorotica TaxID=188477 RepID=A0A3S0ZH56_ELYCH|nr:hypothetical protein EGW08_017489 [Elysia chlorotica]
MVQDVLYNLCVGVIKEKLRLWLLSQEEWTNQLVLENIQDPFWRHVAYLGQWLSGLYEGYNTTAKNDPSLSARDWFEFRLLQATGSVADLIKHARQHYSRSSALIKLLPGFEEIFLGHCTWFRYESTARIFKTYDLNLEGTVARSISFSSYGGNLQSVDDFYLMGGQLAVLQTSNDIFNDTLYDLVKPQSLLTWQRVQAANLLARGGQEWAGLVSRHSCRFNVSRIDPQNNGLVPD